MGINYSSPAPSKSLNFNFITKPEFSSYSGKDYFIEAFRNIENATLEEKHYIASLILPLYLKLTSQENINFFLDYYIHNESIQERNVFIARDINSHQIEAVLVHLIAKEYLNENDYSKENLYAAVSGIFVVSETARNKGIYSEISALEMLLISRRNLGTNVVFFDCVLNPLVYMKITKHFLVYPNSMIETPKTIEKLMKKLMNRFEYVSAGEENPFVVVDETKMELPDKEKWFKNYDKLPKEVRYYIDLTKLRSEIGILYSSQLY